MTETTSCAPIASGEEKIAKVYELATSGRNVFLHGMAGCGKSFALHRVALLLRQAGMTVACTASTGCAATAYADDVGICGSTLHSWAGVGLAETTAQKLYARVKGNVFAHERVTKTSVLAIDEISMISADLWRKLDSVFRDVREQRALPFGGLIVLIAGDLMQLPPVEGDMIFNCLEWELCHFEVVEFDEPYRYRNDLRYWQIMKHIRLGEIIEEDMQLLESCIKTTPAVSDSCIVPTVLFPRKYSALQLNNNELAKLPGEMREFAARDTFYSDVRKGRTAPMPGVYSYILDKTISSYIKLKVGAQVMLKKNLDVQRGLANGSRGIVVGLSSAGATVEFRNQQRVFVEPAEWKVGTYPQEASRRQIPLILAWGLTIHASQGSTVELLKCDIGKRTFADGQAYVALSRVCTLAGLQLIKLDRSVIRCNTAAKEYLMSLGDANTQST